MANLNDLGAAEPQPAQKVPKSKGHGAWQRLADAVDFTSKLASIFIPIAIYVVGCQYTASKDSWG